MKRVVKRLRDVFAEAPFVVRADAGFAIPELYEYCEEEGLDYIIGLITNDRLLALADELSQRAQERFEQTQIKQRLFAETSDQAGSWNKSRRVIIKAEHNKLGSNRRFVVTNM